VAHAEWRHGIGLIVRAGNSSLNFFFALYTCEGVALTGGRERRRRKVFFKATAMNEVDAGHGRATLAESEGGREWERGESLTWTRQRR
jgi:hypothetical protein